MARMWILVLLALIPAPAVAGIRAIYGAPLEAPTVIEIADNGDINAGFADDWHLIVRGDRAFIVEDRLTGPLVMRVEDLAALLPAPSRPQAATPASGSGIVERGTGEVNGWAGQAYFSTLVTGPEAQTPVAVISSDPALSDLGVAMRRVFAAESLVGELYWGWSPDLARTDDALHALLEHGAPLRFGDLTLRSFEQVPIDSARFALPAEPESAEAIHRRHATEVRDDHGSQARNRRISRAIFASERLWLLTDAGELASLADGEQRRRIHDLGDKVLDICVRDNVPIALTGERGDGEGWTIWRWQAGSWRAGRTIPRSFDALVALSCSPGGEMALTSDRLIDLTGRTPAVRLSEPLYPALVRAVVHVRAEAVYVGINAGEWGGGLRRIDRHTGEVSTIARMGAGCEGPLNTNCDPVNGIADIPWQPRCIAAAIGLIHFEAHGRIVSVCPDGVEQIFVATGDADMSDPAKAELATQGDYGSVAFFGLAAAPDALIAAGQNGLYRIEANGAGTHRPWPRFVEVDGVLISFALPDVVLVMSELNRRASISGIAPLMAMR